MATLNRNPAPLPADPSKAAAAAKKVAPSAVTPPKETTLGLERHMTVDKNIVDELLLVCGVIGTTTETSSKGVETLVPVTDCLNWLQDLQRALRRDEDLYRPISLLLGNWNVVQKKLLPLVLTCRYDNPMVLTVVKILVILTKPLHENTMRAGRLVIDTKSKKVDEDVIEEQKKLRENAIMQSKMLMEYKKAIVHHPSHRRNKDNSDSHEGGLLSIFVSLLAEPLSKSGAKRTDADHLTIELVLHLFRNILCAEPILKGSQSASAESAQLHNECISLFERELVLEILLVICQEMELRENAQYNLLMMELLHHLLKSQDPTAIARCMSEDVPTEARHNTKENQQGSAVASKPTKTNSLSTQSRATDGLLRSKLARDRQQFRSGAPARHGNFGGTLMLKRQDGKHKYVSASAVLDRKTEAAIQAEDLAGPKRRKNRMTEPFIGSGRTLLAHTAQGKLLDAQRGPAAQRAKKTLHRFCQRFLDKCYGPVMKSLKNEFRRDSVRLDGEQDQVILFRIIWFFYQWYRVSGYGKELQEQAAKEDTTDGKESAKTNSALGQLIFTMDVFSFNLVLNAASTFVDAKKYSRLAQTVALYSEMMHMLHSMYNSKDPTEQMMALGLMNRLFYGSEPVDRLPKLLSKWMPGTATREYVCDLVELCHITMKLLDANQKACAGIRESEEARQATVVVKGKKKTKIQTNNAVLQMKLAASDFDTASYFTRKIVSNHVVFLYTKLLEQYEFNAPQVNHRIVAFFLRLSKVKLHEAEETPQSSLLLGDGSNPLVNLLTPKTTTMEPMLYNMHMIPVLNRILNDSLLAKDPSYNTLRSWAAGVVHNFANLAESNPVMFVEILLKHTLPHRFCEAATNLYVTEELQMIAQKELLLEAQRLEMLNDDDQSEDDYDGGIEDEEVEFADTEMDSLFNKASSKRRKSDLDDSGDEGRDTTKTTKKKRRLHSKFSSSNSADPESSDEELEFDTTPAEPAKTDAESTSKKSKLKRKAFDDSSDEEEDESPASPAKTQKSANPKRRPDFDDSSDEEEKESGATSKTTNSSKKPAIEEDDNDSSDEEDAAERKSRESKKAEEVKQMRRAILEDEGSDEEE